MKVLINLDKVEFIGTKEADGYEKVIDDFNNANCIRILTYGLPEKVYSQKLNAIRCLENKKIIIIVAFPGLKNQENNGKVDYNSYIEDSISSIFDKTFKALKIQDFNSTPFVGICFKNHAKIIGTENIAYIGSANYTTRSFYNYEAGVIVSDKNSLNSIYNDYFDKLHIVPYLKDSYNSIRIKALDVKTKLEEAYSILKAIINDYSNLDLEYIQLIFEYASDGNAFIEYLAEENKKNPEDVFIKNCLDCVDVHSIDSLVKSTEERSRFFGDMTKSEEELSYVLENNYRMKEGIPLYVDDPIPVSEDELYCPLCDCPEDRRHNEISLLWPEYIRDESSVVEVRQKLTSIINDFDSLIDYINDGDMLESYKEQVIENGTNENVPK